MAVAFALGDVPDGPVVLAVVVLNALIGFAQEYRAGKAIQALAQHGAGEGAVRRAVDPGRRGRPSCRGCRVARGRRAGRRGPEDPAGARADEAALTGESVPVDKAADPVNAAAGLAERRSLLHGGTLVTAGMAEAVVVATGESVSRSACTARRAASIASISSHMRWNAPKSVHPCPIVWWLAGTPRRSAGRGCSVATAGWLARRRDRRFGSRPVQLRLPVPR